MISTGIILPMCCGDYITHVLLELCHIKVVISEICWVFCIPTGSKFSQPVFS